MSTQLKQSIVVYALWIVVLGTIAALLLTSGGMLHHAAAASSHLLAGPCGGSTGWCAVNHLS